jgi:hypothetical protein
LNDSHDQIYSGAHIIRGEPAHERIEFRRSRADAEQERYFDEDD